MSEIQPLMTVQDVRKNFGGVRALQGAEFVVAPRSVTSLIGPNGAGKTTMFNVISGFYKADSGAMEFNGTAIERTPPHRITKLGLTRTFQQPRIIDRLTVLENMMMAQPNNPGDRPWGIFLRPFAVRRHEAQARERSLELLNFIKLDRLANDFGGTLSGGQRKLLEFGRSLMAGPSMVMMDEPMAGVNRTLGWELLDHIRQLRKDRGITFLIIEHDMEVVMTISDRVIVMDQGAVIATGSADEVRRDQRVIDAYLGVRTDREASIERAREGGAHAG